MKKKPTPKEDQELVRYQLTYGSKIKHEVDFAQEILKEIKRKDYAGTTIPLRIPLGVRSFENDINDAINDIKHFFLLHLPKGLIKNLVTQHDDKGDFVAYHINFDADIHLVKYLEDFVATNGGEYETIEFESDYGFYKSGNRINHVPYTTRGGSQSFNFLIALKNKGRLSASEIAKQIGVTRSNGIADVCRRINAQFKKHCKIFDDLILLDLNDGKYSINKKFILREAKKLTAMS